MGHGGGGDPSAWRWHLSKRTLPRGHTWHVNGVRIDAVTREGFLETVGAFLADGDRHVVHFCSADPTVRARRDDHYRRVLNAGALNVPDGISVASVLRLHGVRTERLAGSDAMRLLVDHGRQARRRHYLFGSSEETLGRLSAALETDFPGVEIVGAHSPPFRELTADELDRAASAIRETRAEHLWVGLGTPKQDLVAEELRRRGAAPTILCVGAAFDFLAGTKRRAPRWMQAAGLEWLHRLATEPRRLAGRYTMGVALFVGGVLADETRRVMRARRASPG
jgi:N-acetylglucosaminyldiphosphoundecaprenol N-acetyl-beta-D-mannosaminyltransferase